MAALFTELADIMEIAGENHFKVRAYRTAAAAIMAHPGDIEKAPAAEIADIRGVGKAISEKIEAIRKSGTFPTLERWRQSGFATLRPLLGNAGLGMRKLRGLIRKHGFSSLDDLKRAAAEGRMENSGEIDIETINYIKGL